jgi:hypothetical protein
MAGMAMTKLAEKTDGYLLASDQGVVDVWRRGGARRFTSTAARTRPSSSSPARSASS